jgi:hypothetical protein
MTGLRMRTTLNSRQIGPEMVKEAGKDVVNGV